MLEEKLKAAERELMEARNLITAKEEINTRLEVCSPQTQLGAHSPCIPQNMTGAPEKHSSTVYLCLNRLNPKWLSEVLFVGVAFSLLIRSSSHLSTHPLKITGESPKRDSYS